MTPTPTAPTLFAGTLASLLVLLVISSTAEARPKPRERPAPVVDADADDAARVGGGPVAEYIFDTEDVDGLVLRPEGMPVAQHTRVRFPSLLNIRGHFVPELVRLAKDL